MGHNESQEILATSQERFGVIVTHEEYLEQLRAVAPKTPEEARAFLKSLGLLKKRRILEGEELEQVLTMLRLLGPGEASNNQRVWTRSWRVGDIEYNHHVGDGFAELEEVTDDDE
jgi:ribosomal protein L30/L7E